jgi:diguanylate cyclase (GGDEF)-like protein/PAS domain S-box-containing protein
VTRAALPPDEEARLAALAAYHILDTAPESAFDAVTRLAAAICDTPIALISLVDRQRQWFKSSLGFPGVAETPRDAAFCAHSILSAEMMEVADASQDPRFQDNPLVQSEPKIRFYAGMPLTAGEGFKLGTLCVMDRRPRRLTHSQQAALRELAGVVVRLLEARKFEAEAAHLGSLLDESSSEIYVFDARTLKFLHVNKGAREATGYSAAELQTLTPLDLQPQLSAEAFRTAIDPLLTGERQSLAFESVCVRKDGSSYPVDSRVQMRRENGGTVMYAVVTDISARKRLESDLRESQRRLQEITDNVPALIAYVGADQRYRFFNKTYNAWFGSAKAIEPGMSMRQLLGDALYEHAKPHVETCLSGRAVTFESETSVAGARRVGQVSYVPRLAEAGAGVEGFYVLVTDITARKHLENALFEEKERAQTTLRAIGDAVITTGVDGRVLYLNPIAETMTGWRNDEALGLPLAQVFKIMNGVTRNAAPSPIELALREDMATGLSADTVLVRRDGYECAIESSAAPLHDHDANLIGAVLVFHDVSEARAMALKMSHLAQHDFLTGLPNRALLNDRLAQAIMLAQRHQKRLALLFLDLDRFKHVNDTLGHSIGDALLQEVGKRLIACVRGSDTVCRQGGDEFVILLSEIEDAQAAAQVAEKLLTAVTAPYLVTAHELHVTGSLGLSVFPEDGQDVETLIKTADTAMYHAKELGRNNYQFFTQAMNDRAVERFTLERNLRRALSRNEFMLYYQPKVNLGSGAIIGAEALIRWRHGDGNLVAPGQFIPVAEECGLILPIGEWVMHEACRQNRAWQDAGFPTMPVAVNVSPAQFRKKNFLHLVTQVLADTRLEPRFLELELTESVVMQDVELTTGLLEALTKIGVQLSIDDFGTGYSSLSYLKRFPIDALKIDQSFVRDITTDPDDAAITRAIINMAKSLKQRVIAEGVETADQLAFLRTHACDEMQGYFFSRPLAAADFQEKFFRGDLLRTMPMEWLGYFPQAPN